MAKVEIYLKSTCPYCSRASQLLASRNADVDVINLDAGGPRRDEMIKRAGRSTVPQIFIGGTHVGGCDDLFALDKQGKLEAMLSA